MASLKSLVAKFVWQDVWVCRQGRRTMPQTNKHTPPMIRENLKQEDTNFLSLPKWIIIKPFTAPLCQTFSSDAADRGCVKR